MPYIKEMFDPISIEHAKQICLTPSSTDPDKFITETNFFIEFLIDNKYVTDTTLVADFGCGVGRVTKRLIEEVGCNITGFDISAAMLNTAVEYIDNQKFIPHMYRKNIQYTGDKFDIVIASFVLQHSEHPEYDIKFIKQQLKENGLFVVVNEPVRYVPSNIDQNGYIIWNDDGISIWHEIEKEFELIGEYKYYTRPDKCLTVWQNK